MFFTCFGVVKTLNCVVARTTMPSFLTSSIFCIQACSKFDLPESPEPILKSRFFFRSYLTDWTGLELYISKDF